MHHFQQFSVKCQKDQRSRSAQYDENAEEDEQICDWLLSVTDQHIVPLTLQLNHPGIVETISAKHKAPGYRFYPDKIKGEGFFIAAFKYAIGLFTSDAPSS